MKQCALIGALGTMILAVAWGCGGSQPEAAAPESSAASPAGSAADPSSPSSAGTPAESTGEGETAAPSKVDDAPGVGSGEDSRTMEAISAVVKAHRKEARVCYEKALKQIPGLKGDVVIHFILKPNGRMKHAEINEERSTIREAAVTGCVIDVLMALEFPKSSKGMETAVNYPFNFNP